MLCEGRCLAVAVWAALLGHVTCRTCPCVAAPICLSSRFGPGS